MSSTDSLIFEDPEEVLAEVIAPERRKKQAFKEATVRAPTKIEAMASAEDDFDLFGFIDVKPSLRDTYVDMNTLLTKHRGTNGFKSISTFTGCGGSFTGFALAGWDELLAVEFVTAARETLAVNYDLKLIEPDNIYDKVNRWLAENPSDLKVHFTRKTRVNGVSVPSTIDWETTIEGAAKTKDDKIMEAMERLRYQVTYDALIEAKATGKALVWGDDIRGLDGQAILDALGLEPGELDCFEGSPPCKSFSTAGNREHGWGKISAYSDERRQSTDGLFFEFLRLLTILKPKTFIAENVAGIEMGSASTTFLQPLIRSFDELGYTVQSKKLNASEYGVAQVRPRVFIQGVRKDLLDPDTLMPIRPAWPAETNDRYAVKDALEAAGESNIEELTWAWLGERQGFLDMITARGWTEDDIPKDSWWFKDLEKAKEKGKPVKEMRYGLGKIWNQLPLGASPENKAYQMLKCHPNLPAPTITATAAGNVPSAGPVHPHENRKFTINEYRWLFSFPRDYVFTGHMDQQGERMGRSVAPYLMKALAGAIADNITRAVYAEE